MAEKMKTNTLWLRKFDLAWKNLYVNQQLMVYLTGLFLKHCPAE